MKNVGKLKIIKVISIIVLITFSFQNITWANPDIFQSRSIVAGQHMAVMGYGRQYGFNLAAMMCFAKIGNEFFANILKNELPPDHERWDEHHQYLVKEVNEYINTSPHILSQIKRDVTRRDISFDGETLKIKYKNVEGKEFIVCLARGVNDKPGQYEIINGIPQIDGILVEFRDPLDKAQDTRQDKVIKKDGDAVKPSDVSDETKADNEQDQKNDIEGKTDLRDGFTRIELLSAVAAAGLILPIVVSYPTLLLPILIASISSLILTLAYYYSFPLFKDLIGKISLRNPFIFTELAGTGIKVPSGLQLPVLFAAPDDNKGKGGKGEQKPQGKKPVPVGKKKGKVVARPAKKKVFLDNRSLLNTLLRHARIFNVKNREQAEQKLEEILSSLSMTMKPQGGVSTSVKDIGDVLRDLNGQGNVFFRDVKHRSTAGHKGRSSSSSRTGYKYFDRLVDNRVFQDRIKRTLSTVRFYMGNNPTIFGQPRRLSRVYFGSSTGYFDVRDNLQYAHVVDIVVLVDGKSHIKPVADIPKTREEIEEAFHEFRNVRKINVEVVGFDELEAAVQGDPSLPIERIEHLRTLLIKIYREYVQIAGSSLVKENNEEIFSERLKLLEIAYVNRLVRELNEFAGKKEKLREAHEKKEDERVQLPIKRRENLKKANEELGSIEMRIEELEVQASSLFGTTDLTAIDQKVAEELPMLSAKWNEAYIREGGEGGKASIKNPQKHVEYQQIYEQYQEKQGLLNALKNLHKEKIAIEEKIKEVRGSTSGKVEEINDQLKQIRLEIEETERNYELLCKRIEDAMYGQTYITPGTVIGGKYQIVSELEKGGFGIVYNAKYIPSYVEQSIDDRERERMRNAELAIKFFVPAIALSERQREVAEKRFLNERKTHKELSEDSAPIPMFRDEGEYADLHYLVMDRVPLKGKGMTLDKIIAEIEAGHIKLDYRQKVILYWAITKRLRKFHGKGGIHRDIKPAQFMIPMAEDGSLVIPSIDTPAFDDFVDEIYLLDMGTVKKGKQTDDGDAFVMGDLLDVSQQLTQQAKSLPFSPSYMSPETVELLYSFDDSSKSKGEKTIITFSDGKESAAPDGESVEVAEVVEEEQSHQKPKVTLGTPTDIYSWGVSGYELFTTELTTSGAKNPVAIMGEVLNNEVESPRRVIARLNRAMEPNAKTPREVLDKIHANLYKILSSEKDPAKRVVIKSNDPKDVVWDEVIVRGNEENLRDRLEDILWQDDSLFDLGLMSSDETAVESIINRLCNNITYLVFPRIPQMDEHMELLLLKCLEKDPENRPSVKVLDDEIDKLLHNRQEAMIYQPAGEASWGTRFGKWVERNAKLALTLAGVIILTLVTAVVGLVVYFDQKTTTLNEAAEKAEAARTRAERQTREAETAQKTLAEEKDKLTQEKEKFEKEVERKNEELADKEKLLAAKDIEIRKKREELLKMQKELDAKTKQVEEVAKQLAEFEKKKGIYAKDIDNLTEKKGSLQESMKEMTLAMKKLEEDKKRLLIDKKNLEEEKKKLEEEKEVLARKFKELSESVPGIFEEAKKLARNYEDEEAFEALANLPHWGIDNEESLAKLTLGFDEVFKIFVDNGQFNEAVKLEEVRRDLFRFGFSKLETEASKKTFESEINAVKAMLAAGYHDKAMSQTVNLMEKTIYKNSKEWMEILKGLFAGIVIEHAYYEKDAQKRTDRINSAKALIDETGSEDERYFRFAGFYMVSGDYAAAAKYYKRYCDHWAEQAKEKDIAEDVKKNRLEKASYGLISSAVAHLKRAEAAKSKDKKEVAEYAMKILQEWEKSYTEQKEHLAWANFVKGELYVLMKERDKAEEAYNGSLKLANENGLKVIIALCEARLGQEVKFSDLLNTWTTFISSEVPLPFRAEIRSILRSATTKYRSELQKAKREAEEEKRKKEEEERRKKEAEEKIQGKLLEDIKWPKEIDIKLIQINKGIQTLTRNKGFGDKQQRNDAEKQLAKLMEEKEKLEAKKAKYLTQEPLKASTGGPMAVVFSLNILLGVVTSLAKSLSSKFPKLSGYSEEDKGKGLILFADDMIYADKEVDYSAVFDLDKLAKTIGEEGSSLIGKIVIYAENINKAKILETIIKTANKNAVVEIVTSDKLVASNNGDCRESTIKDLLEYCRHPKNGIGFKSHKDVLGIIRGRLSEKEKQKLEIEYRSTAHKIPPIVEFVEIKKGNVYSIMEAVNILINQLDPEKRQDVSSLVILALKPIVKMSETLQEEYNKYIHQVMALESAA